MLLEQHQDSRRADPAAVLSLAELAEGLSAETQLQGLVVGIEGESDREPGAILPASRLERAARANVNDDPEPGGLVPLSRIAGGVRVRHGRRFRWEWKRAPRSGRIASAPHDRAAHHVLKLIPDRRSNFYDYSAFASGAITGPEGALAFLQKAACKFRKSGRAPLLALRLYT
jgi:hypothetical protein